MARQAVEDYSDRVFPEYQWAINRYLNDFGAGQEAILHNVLSPLVNSPIAYGIGRRTQIDAARQHVGMPYVASGDIDSFFASVTELVVRWLFSSLSLGPDVVDLLTRLVTLRGCLPQGAPTSSAVANLLLAASDRRLNMDADRLGVVLTRFVDDYAISGRDLGAIREMMGLIEQELQRLELQLNPSKCAVMPRSEPQLVHGLHVNSCVSIPKGYRKMVRCEVFKARDHGPITQKEFDRITGLLAYVRGLHFREASKLESALRDVRVVPDPKMPASSGIPRLRAFGSPGGRAVVMAAETILIRRRPHAAGSIGERPRCRVGSGETVRERASCSAESELRDKREPRWRRFRRRTLRLARTSPASQRRPTYLALSCVAYPADGR